MNVFPLTAAALVLALAGPSALAQSGKFGLDKLRDAINNQVPGQGQPPSPSSASSPAQPAQPVAAPAPSTAAPAPAVGNGALPDIDQWSTQLPPVNTQLPYAVLAGIRFEAFSNPCASGSGRCWVPIIQLPMSGRMSTGQEVHVAYKAGGKPWFTEKFRPADATALLRDRNGVNLLYRFRSGRNQEHLARHTGRIDFEVSFVDPLAGGNRKVGAGHFVVGGGANDIDFYVSYDWATEVMWVDFMGRGNPALDYPGLVVQGIFLQPTERSETMSLHLFHKGKEIASADRFGNDFTTSARNSKTRQGYGAIGAAWSLPNVVAYDRRPEKGGFFVLSENPGEYTLKVLRNGELAREANFTIKPDGIIDRSLNVAANLPHGFTVLRAKVHGQQDRAKANFKADGLWGAAR
jgi:hypothetical protein